MPRTQSQRAVAAQNAQQTDEVFVVLLTLSHPTLAQPIRVCNNNENVVSRGNTFIAVAFDIELPGEDDSRPGLATLRIDNVDRAVLLALRQIATPPTARIEVVLAATPDVVEVDFAGLILRNAIYDDLYVTGELAFEQIIVEPVSIAITPARFPALF